MRIHFTPICLSLVFLSSIFAIPTHALSDEARGAISQYCGSIRQTLRSIQREDSRARIAIGAIYETLATTYITPLNLRLIANNNGDPNLVSLQSSFADTRSDFAAKFTEYSRSLENLIATDCQTQPDLFYEKLESTRALRSELRAYIEELHSIAADYGSTVSALKEEL